MKTMTCDLCDHTESAEDFDAWMDKLKPHYVAEHAEVMTQKAGTPEEMKAEMMKWMEENKLRFDTTEVDSPVEKVEEV